MKLKATHCFIMKILNKRKLQQIGSNHLSYTELKDFMKLYKNFTRKGRTKERKNIVYDNA